MPISSSQLLPDLALHAVLCHVIVSYLFLQQGMGEVEDYVFEEELDVFLVERKNKILVARREVNSVMGWDVPSSSLKFSVIQGKGKFGDIFIGCMDGQAILIKVLQTDCNQDAKATFNRELDILR